MTPEPATDPISKSSEPEVGQPEALPGQWTCITCGSPSFGRFCSKCGEERPDPDGLTLRHFLEHAVETMFHADSKIFRSVRLLFTRPGFLTWEFVRGRRKPYLHPFRLFFVINLLYFLVQPVIGWTGLVPTLYTYVNAQAYSPLVVRLLQHRFGSLAFTSDFVHSFDHRVSVLARALVVLMVPIFALLVGVLQWRKRRTYGEHLVFALHYYGFWLLSVMILLYGSSTLLNWVLSHWGLKLDDSHVNRVFGWLSDVGIGVYLFFALRSAYKDGIVMSVIKAAALSLATWPIVDAYRFIVFLATLYSA